MYHRRHFSFTAYFARKRIPILCKRKNDWPCITFEALSIREKLSLSSISHFRRASRRLSCGRENELLADERKSEKGLGSVTKKETGRETNIRRRFVY